MDVDRVVLVDDSVSVVSEPQVKLAKLHKVGATQWDRQGDYDDFFSASWQAASPLERRAAQDAAVKKSPELASSDIDVMRALFADAQWLAISPASWSEDPSACFGEAGPERSLVFFDRNLGSEGGPDGGAALLGAYLRSDRSGAAVLLTSTIDAGNELEIPDDVTKAADLPASEILIASKEHLTRDRCMEFVDFVRMGLTLESLRTIRGRVRDALEIAHTEAIKDLVDLNPRLIEDIVIRASRREGIWEVDTYLRIFEIFQRRALHEAATVQRDPKLIRAIADARRSAAIVHIDHDPSKQVVTELMAAENYTSGELVNKAGLPIENGDLFEIDGDFYILAVQACDLMFRDQGGSRKQMVLARLLSVRWADDGQARERGMQLPPGLAMAMNSNLERDEPDGAYVVDFALTRHLSLEVLDLCSFDPSGRSRLDIRSEQPLIPPLVPGQHSRFKLLFDKAAKSSRSKIRTPRRGRLYLDTQGDIPLKPKWSAKNLVLQFDVRRIARLDTLHSTELLGTFAQDAARPVDLPPLDAVAG
jgi:hypothetical protein